MKTNVNKIFDEIIKNLDLIKIESFESYKDVKINFPRNYESGKAYKGSNAFSLLFFNLANGYDLEYFLTANQLVKIGNADFKGKKPTKIKFFKLWYQNINNKKIRYTIVYLPDNPKKKGRGAERKRKCRERSIKKGKNKRIIRLRKTDDAFEGNR